MYRLMRELRICDLEYLFLASADSQVDWMEIEDALSSMEATTNRLLQALASQENRLQRSVAVSGVYQHCLVSPSGGSSVQDEVGSSRRAGETCSWEGEEGSRQSQ